MKASVNLDLSKTQINKLNTLSERMGISVTGLREALAQIGFDRELTRMWEAEMKNKHQRAAFD